MYKKIYYACKQMCVSLSLTMVLSSNFILEFMFECSLKICHTEQIQIESVSIYYKCEIKISITLV